MYSSRSYHHGKEITALAQAKALEYAKLSQDYTFIYDGWDKERRYERILTGIFGQEYVYRLLKLNKIEVKLDDTSYKSNDLFDLQINNSIFDIKTTNSRLLPQVGAHLKNKKGVDFYMFCQTTAKLSYATILGYAPRIWIFKPEFFIAEGQKIPNTPLQNRFKLGSYFFTDELIPIMRLIPNLHDDLFGNWRKRPRPCRICRGIDFWISKSGKITCELCHPPATEKIVARRIQLDSANIGDYGPSKLFEKL